MLSFVLFSWWNESLHLTCLSYVQTIWGHISPLVVGGTNLVVTGDSFNLDDSAIIISNHQVDIDWQYLWLLSAYLGANGRVKICAKSDLKYVPVIGWVMYFFDFLFLSRKWENDQVVIERTLGNWVRQKLKLYFIFFPEGTTISDKGMATSLEFAKKSGRPTFKHLLSPRVTGLKKVTECLTHVNAIYDVTVGYDGYSGEIPSYDIGYERTVDLKVPSFKKVLSGQIPEKIHYHVVRRERPQTADVEEFTKWIDNIWSEKDKRLTQFIEKKTLLLDNE